MALPVVCVEDQIADDLVEALVELGKNLKMGQAWDPTTELGPLVTDEHRRFVLDWIDKGVSEGAELVLDGRGAVVPGCEGGFFVGATVFDHVEPDMRVGIDEIFGPVLCVERVADFEEGLEVANSSEFANGSAIFTQSGYYSASSRDVRTPGWSGSTSASQYRFRPSRSAATRAVSSAICTSWAGTASPSTLRRSP